jgi:hypothetical protein
MAKKKQTIKLYIPIHFEGKGKVFVTIEEALKKPEVALQATEYALAELERWHAEWAKTLLTIQDYQPSKLGECVSGIIGYFSSVKRANKKHWPE